MQSSPEGAPRRSPASETTPAEGEGGSGRGLTVTRPDLIVDGSDREFRRLVYALLTVSIRFDRLREQMGRLMGLSGLQYHILMVVEELAEEREVSVGAVAEALHVSSAYITMETAKLVRAGLLTKRPNPRDRRGVLLALTAKGRRLVHQSAPWLREINDVLFAHLGRDDFRHLRRIMEGMVDDSARALAIAEGIAAADDAPRNDVHPPHRRPPGDTDRPPGGSGAAGQN